MNRTYKTRGKDVAHLGHHERDLVCLPWCASKEPLLDEVEYEGTNLEKGATGATESLSHFSPGVSSGGIDIDSRVLTYMSKSRRILKRSEVEMRDPITLELGFRRSMET